MHSLKKYFGGITALDGVSLDLKPHKVNLLIGSNGSGKTTLIDSVSGMFPVDDGKVLLHGSNITNENVTQIFHKGLIRTFQIPRVFNNLSVLENLLIVHSRPYDAFSTALISSRWRRPEEALIKKALDILEYLHLTEHLNRHAQDLSGGQLKLLELGKTIVSDANLVLLDEPIAGINPVLAHKICSMILETSKKNRITYLLIEHRLDIVLKYADYVFVMDRGKIIAEGDPQHVLEDRLVQESYLGR